MGTMKLLVHTTLMLVSGIASGGSELSESNSSINVQCMCRYSNLLNRRNRQKRPWGHVRHAAPSHVSAALHVHDDM